jgi:hypothetical protein
LVANHIDFFSKELTTEFQVTLIIMIVLNSMALMFLVHLIVFHITLKFKGLTTYEFLKLKESVTRESTIVVRVKKNEL